ncbi:hypothetical protein CsSME_00029456 [Camellia sinensis var. sinensis]
MPVGSQPFQVGWVRLLDRVARGSFVTALTDDTACSRWNGFLSADVGDSLLAKYLDVIGIWCNAEFHKC